MGRKMIVWMLLISLCMFTVGGCKEDSGSGTNYQQQAEEQITEENLDQQMEQMEQEIEEDTP